MSDFPREALVRIADAFDETANAFGEHTATGAAGGRKAKAVRQAIKAYDELAERLVMDAAAHRAEMGQLRAELAEARALASVAYKAGFTDCGVPVKPT